MTSFQTDNLSAIARELLRADAELAYRSLGPTARQPADASLDPSTAAITANLAALTPDSVLHRPPTERPAAGHAAVERPAAECVVAALWLWHDFLDPAHQIVQRVDEPIGAYWHGILHRRERDFSNAKYWFARGVVDDIGPTLATRADDLLRSWPADKQLLRLTANGWNPAAFVDLAARLVDQPNDPLYTLAVAIQQLEWQVLFDHCVRQASAGR